VLVPITVAACIALATAGCTSSTQDDPQVTAAPPGLAEYYSQTLDWVGCDEDPAFSSGTDWIDAMLAKSSLQCTWMTVPLDYSDPSGQTIKIAAARLVAKDSKGSVVINPGGPGGSGVDSVNGFADAAGTKLTASFDIVGFDPRGVSRSAPVDCVDDDMLDVFLAADVDTTTEAGRAQAEDLFTQFGAGCAERTGPVLAHVDTISAARDMDVLRAALGEPTLTYVGLSYGTKLGATYAALFPDKVGRMVLDGGLDPTISAAERTVAQVAGFELALRAYATDCLAGDDCPLSGSVDDAVAQVVSVVEQAQESPMTTNTGRPLTGSLAITGIITPLYSQESWYLLSTALHSAIDEDDGSWLLVLADSYSGRCEGLTCPLADGYYSNMMEATTAISCLDDRLDTDPQTLADQIAQVVPSLEGIVTHLVDDSCASWPVPVVGPLESYAATGAPPIVVIGTTNDPATPYEWSQSLAKTLDSGVLVTFIGEGHTAYLGGTACIQKAVDDYLVDGTVPKNGLTC